MDILKSINTEMPFSAIYGLFYTGVFGSVYFRWRTVRCIEFTTDSDSESDSSTEHNTTA